MVHTAHHHLPGVAKRAAAAATRGSHTETLARGLGGRIDNACRSCRTNQTACTRWVHVIMRHIHSVWLARRGQVLSVNVAVVIGAESVALEGVLTRHQVTTLSVHLLSHLVIERSGRPATRHAYVCFAFMG